MNIDRVLNIHQSYSLEKVSALNKQMIIAQYAQCEKINSLQKEVRASNSISRQILENQLKELQQKELLKYYKSLAFNIKEAINILAEQQDKSFRSFILSLYGDIIYSNLVDVKANLEDISDKEFCSAEIKRLSQYQQLSESEIIEYQSSYFFHFTDISKDYKQKEDLLKCKEKECRIAKVKQAKKTNGVENKKPKKHHQWRLNTMYAILTFYIFALIGDYQITGLLFSSDAISAGVFFLIIIVCLAYYEKKFADSFSKRLDAYNEAKNNSRMEMVNNLTTLERDCEQLKTELRSHEYHNVNSKITSLIPNWQTIIEQVYSLLPLSKLQNDEKEKKYDPIIFEVARLIVIHQQGSSALIQRKFSFGYNRVQRIMDQLEKIGVVGPTKGFKPREVLIKDEASLQELLTDINL